MDTLDRMPFKARKAVFERLEKLASKANMTQEERAQYEEEWKVYNDYFNTLDFAEKKGMQKEKEVTARIMKSKGLSLELISECTGLTTAQKTSWKSTQFQMPAHRTDKSAHLNEMGNHYNPTTLCETSFPSYTRQDIPMHSTKERTKRIQLPDSARDTVQNNSTMPLHRKSGITAPPKIPG